MHSSVSLFSILIMPSMKLGKELHVAREP